MVNYRASRKKRAPQFHGVSIVDIFCGAGGLTHGLISEGLSVTAGIDLDPACKFPFEHNNPGAKFLHRDVADIAASEINSLFPPDNRRVMVGCAPCQPFSKYTRGLNAASSSKWDLLEKFGALICEVLPDVVSMENVPDLLRHSIYQKFTSMLENAGYHIAKPCLAFGPDYGLPQRRTRVVFLASLLGPIAMLPPTHQRKHYLTVKDVIGNLEPILAGAQSHIDPLHKSSNLSARNLRRIRSSTPGGTWRDWPSELVASCHKTSAGATYPAVYGRMEWDSPSPTITTQFYGFGNGRFGHPIQDRAISLREGALLQTFPKRYQFVEPEKEISFKIVGRLIGNAVPVSLGRAIGRSIRCHLEHHLNATTKLPAKEGCIS